MLGILFFYRMRATPFWWFSMQKPRIFLRSGLQCSRFLCITFRGMTWRSTVFHSFIYKESVNVCQSRAPFFFSEFAVCTDLTVPFAAQPLRLYGLSLPFALQINDLSCFNSNRHFSHTCLLVVAYFVVLLEKNCFFFSFMIRSLSIVIFIFAVPIVGTIVTVP